MNDQPPAPEMPEDNAPQAPVPESAPVASAPLPQAKNNRISRLFYLSALIGLILGMAVFSTLVAPGPLRESKNVIIPHGTNVRGIADILDQNKSIYHPLLFRLAAKIFAFNALQAGEYQITPQQSIAAIVLMMHDGHSIVHRFTIAEGLTSAEVVRLLNNSTILNGDIITPPPEGSLLPETYLYTYGDSRAKLVERMQKDMHDTLNDLWAKRDASVPVDTQEKAVIMASVVEKETGKASERPRIAGVFYNRLKQKMRLQSDPTVIYAIVKEKGLLDHDLSHNDLSFPSPINTYMSDGLPSQPICNPGRASLEAVLHPESNDYLYFVADGTGGHVFARTLAEHNQNVTRWNHIRKSQESDAGSEAGNH